MLVLETYASVAKERRSSTDGLLAHEETMTKLKNKLGHVFCQSSLQSGITSVIETDFLVRDGVKCSEKVVENPLSPNCSPDDSIPMKQSLLSGIPSVDETESATLASILNHKLEQVSRQSNLSKYSIFLPCNLVDKIAKDMVRMSCCEPCGIRGLAIYLYLQCKQDGQTKCLKLGCIECGQNKTFELHLTLMEDKKKWFHLKDLFSFFLHGCMSDDEKQEIYVSPGYQLEKKKLYRLNNYIP